MTDRELNNILKHANVTVYCDTTMLDYNSNGTILCVSMSNSSQWIEDIEYSVNTEEKSLTNSQCEVIRQHLIDAVNEDLESTLNSAFTTSDYQHFESLIFN